MNSELLNFFRKIKGDVNPVDFSSDDIQKFDAIPILNTQCLYVYDFPRNKIVYCRNTHVLGFNNEEFTIDHSSNYHPDDRVLVNVVTQSSVKHGVEHNMMNHNCCLELTFRLKRKDGTYAQVLKQTTIYHLDDNQRMSTNITILSDISFIQTPGYVNWSFKMNNLNSDFFEDKICGDIKNIFSKKELELIPCFVRGASSKEIADQFFISKHTVDTHRRNIKSKSGCKSMYDLLTFSSRNKLI
ncbi:LuxR family transcriptional regulator [Brumimicrobium glaciale]|uniref:LuxR family transcriptional regulator n=1 Tax=Brumimicrobium glaciale TaxID=200475 RepID=A0A4Q4KHH5_9FLAO|nr:LuxR C-terminal-related transcriptional regulator [Brumimicrobium glaciale]RYM32575.1 LuxR family transcriptional regulator [Brumimicrobium glaciale]